MKLMSTTISPSATLPEREDSNKILNQLLNCVQRCQKRYGGKTELATDCDPCVAALCLSLEEVFLHGLRSKPQNLQQNTSLSLKQVTDIVSSSLNLNNDTPSFWPFIKSHLTKHEQERYSLLKQIWTDFGRGRAWIRSALNERSLERYFHTVLSHQSTLRLYYEGWALLCDQEKNSMLPNMAAGLGSILFAISIDNPSLNNDVSRKMDRMKSQNEPIIEAPVTDVTQRTEQKRKRKVAKQIISFDEDNSSTLSSSSVPSTSGSITSDQNISQHSTANNSHNYEIANQCSDSNISEANISNSSEEKIVFNDVQQQIKCNSLIPMEKADGIAELTPIIVESIKDSSSLSDETVDEISTDISAVLTVMEVKNKEEQNRLTEKVNMLSKENDNLKLQLKGYVSAMKIIDDTNDDDNKTDNISNETKLYEKKLVQVAQMHAELMEFNDYLQRSLSQKDAVCKRLQTELSDLKGPQNADDNMEMPGSLVNIWIPSAFLTGAGKNAHHVYQIYIRAGTDDWNIYRRYSQFHSLHTDMKKLDSVVSTFDFPPKRRIGKTDSALVEERRKRLQTYLRKIITQWPELSNCTSRFLLEQHLSFFRDQTVDPKAKKPTKSPRHNSNEPHYTGL